ncbi:MAG TPA: c-type cytochrome biogenesis protein CcsB [Mycobacteriales bacterium]
MPVDAGLATLSDHLFTWSIVLYSVALIAYCGEYAFGRRGRVAATSPVVDETVPAAAVPAGAASAGAASANAAPAGGAGGEFPADEEDDGVDGGDRPGRPRRRAPRADRFGRLAVLTTAAGLVLQLSSLTTRGIATGRVPWGNMYEFSSVVGATAVLAFLIVLVRLPQVRYLGMFVMMPVVVLLFLAGTVLYAKAAPLVPALRSYWIVIHVTTISIGTGIFLVSFVGSVLFLVRRRWDAVVATGRTPARFPVTLGGRLPTAEVLDRMAYRTVAFGFPIYTFGIIAGAIWAEAAWGRYWGWDPKETWAFITWVVYAAYLHARATAGWRGAAAARINLLAFATMIFNFFVVNMVVSGLHSYAGLT